MANCVAPQGVAIGTTRNVSVAAADVSAAQSTLINASSPIAAGSASGAVFFRPQDRYGNDAVPTDASHLTLAATSVVGAGRINLTTVSLVNGMRG